MLSGIYDASCVHNHLYNNNIQLSFTPSTRYCIHIHITNVVYLIRLGLPVSDHRLGVLPAPDDDLIHGICQPAVHRQADVAVRGALELKLQFSGNHGAECVLERIIGGDFVAFYKYPRVKRCGENLPKLLSCCATHLPMVIYYES